MKKDKNIFNFSNLVSLVNEEEDISNNIQDNIAKKNNFIKHISDKNNFFANLKKFIPNIYFINTKTLYINAYLSFLISVLFISINSLMSFSTSLIAFAVIGFTIFVTYETFSTLFLFNKFKYPKMLNFILSIDTSYLIKTLQLSKKEDKYQSLEKKNKSLFFKIFSKINLGYKFSFHKNIINEFSNNLSYYDRDFNYRQQEKIERIRKFLNLLIYFNQTKNSEKSKLKSIIFNSLNFAYLPYTLSYIYSFIYKSTIFFPFVIGWSITLLVFSFLITRNVLKNDASAEFQHYSKVQELEEIFKLSDFKEGLITIGFFEPEEILSLDSAFDLNDFIREIQNLSPEKQDIIIKNLTKIIDTPLKSHQTPIIFNH